MGKPETLTLEATDVSQQKRARLSNVQEDMTVGEMVQSLLSQMSLPQNDSQGYPLTYQAFNERSGAFAHSSTKVGEAFEAGDRMVLQPNIDAGGL